MALVGGWSAAIPEKKPAASVRASMLTFCCLIVAASSAAPRFVGSAAAPRFVEAGADAWRANDDDVKSDDVNCTSTCTAQPKPLSHSQKNVLILGDSISSAEIGYLEEVERVLGAAVSVQHVSTKQNRECGTSIGVLACLDGWLAGRDGWDVISMNWGLHDVCPKMYWPISRADYEAHLQTMHNKFAASLAPGGSMLWVSTTPVPPSYKQRNNSDVVDINARAQAYFSRIGVAQEDLYTEVVDACRQNASTRGYPQTSDCPQLQPNGVHFGFVNVSSVGRNFTGRCVARAIQKLL
jgi:hypothetical protein